MKALILVDIQNDFTPATNNKPEGALAVPEGNAVIEIANRLMPSYDLVIATQDWHPAGHKSFASQHEGRNIGDTIEWDGLCQILWPDHCVQNSAGAELCSKLYTKGIHHIVHKGTNSNIDSYSGFFDNGHRSKTNLDDLLSEYKSSTSNEVHIMGLATDYCVKFTALDAIELGYKTSLILSGCRGVNINSDDCDNAIKEMQEAGVKIINSHKE